MQRDAISLLLPVLEFILLDFFSPFKSPRTSDRKSSEIVIKVLSQGPDDELQHKPNRKPVQAKDRRRTGSFIMPSSVGDIRIAGVFRC